MTVMAAAAACIIFDRKIHETLPMALFTVTLSVYALALFMPLNAAVWICIVVFAALLAGAFVKKRRLPRPLTSARIFIPIVLAVIFGLLFMNRKVFFYDDLSYWALYAKNIFAIDKLPHLFENCSVDYKDYTPVIQILQYIAMYGRSSFSEPTLFVTNICLIYILLLPLLFVPTPGSDRGFSLTGLAGIVMYIIFPHILTAQFYYRLGVDLLLALVFGYILYLIFMTERDCFCIVSLAAALSFLALIKTSGIVLCILALIMFAVYEPLPEEGKLQRILSGKAVPVILLSVFSLGAYMSWKLFLHYSWNNGYLSDRVSAGVLGEGFSFPQYTGEVVGNYIRHFFAYPLTRGKIGVTAFVLVLFIVAVHILSKRSGEVGFDGSPTGRHRVMFICVMTGLIVFMTAHLSMYLFVFDEWEAHGLMEFDRYITQYLGGAFMLYSCMLVRQCSPAGSGQSRGKSVLTGFLAASVIVFLVLLPYGDMKTYLVPANYDAMYEKEYAKTAESALAEWNASGIAALDLPHDGSARITVVADAWDEKTQFLEYAAVPQPFNRVVNVPATDPGTINGFIMDFVDEYVYVCDNAADAYEGSWDETSALTSDGSALAAGTLYRVTGSGSGKLLERFE